MPQNACYYTDNKDSCLDNVRFHGIEKYPKKILVHVTISDRDRGISKALIHHSGSLSVNLAIYIKKCLEKRLLSFIEEEKSNKSPNTLIRQKSLKHTQSKTFGGCLAQKVYEGD